MFGVACLSSLMELTLLRVALKVAKDKNHWGRLAGNTGTGPHPELWMQRVRDGAPFLALLPSDRWSRAGPFTDRQERPICCALAVAKHSANPEEVAAITIKLLLVLGC